MSQIHLLNDKPMIPITHFRDYLCREFRFYRSRFNGSGATAADDGERILDLCPVLTREDYDLLEEEIFLRVGKGQFLTDLSSGTTGPHRTRYATAADDAEEAALCRRFFEQCGLGPGDRVLALDVGNPDLYVFYGDVLRDVGVDCFAFGNVTSDFGSSCRQLFTMNPTTIVTIPSVLRKIFPVLLEDLNDQKTCQLARVIYLGETMPGVMRDALEARGLQIYGLYGSTEIGSVAGECRAHCGMHIYNDAVVPSVLNAEVTETRIRGEVVWTTLHFRDYPLVKYATGDMVEIDTRPCDCGLSSPRLLSVKRVQDEFVVYGHKFQHSMFLKALVGVGLPTSFLQIVVAESSSGINITFHLPASLEHDSATIDRVLGDVDEMPYFVDLGFVDYECQFAADPVGSARKLRQVVDERE